MFSSNLSNYSEGVNTAFIVILSIILFFLIALTVTLVFFLVRYREDKNPVAAQIHGNVKLEILWTVVPLLIVLAMFYYGWTAYTPMESDPPEDAIQIEAIARMWKWNFKYKNGLRADSLVVPAGKPVSLNMNAVDVIHSLYIPAFRIKKDIIPGKTRNAWFIANSPGKYDLFCAEYCGLEHSSMITTVTVLSQQEYDTFYEGLKKVEKTGPAEAEANTNSDAVRGAEIVQQMGCNACHSRDGSVIVGPSYLKLFGKKEIVITNGKERQVEVDEEYIRRSIIEPNADIVKGYNKGLMLSYKDQLTDEEIELVIEYVKSLQ